MFYAQSMINVTVFAVQSIGFSNSTTKYRDVFMRLPESHQSTQTLLRDLGGLERWFYVMDRHKPNHFSMAVTVDGFLDRNTLRLALLALQKRHPLLSATVEDNISPLIGFMRSPGRPIPLRVNRRESDVQWKVQMAKESSIRFDTAISPLMRMMLFQGTDRSDIIVSIHHSIADGMALLFLLRDLMASLSGVVLEDLSLPESIEYIRAGTSIADEPLTAMNNDERDGVPPVANLLAYRPSHDELVHFEALQLTEDQTIALTRSAKSQRVTVHSALTAALVKAGSDSDSEWAGDPVRVFTPINIRAVHNIGDDTVVALGAGVVALLPGADADVWALARDAMSGLAYFQQFDQLFTVSAMLGRAAVDPSKTTTISAAYAYDLILTNPGRIEPTFFSNVPKVIDVWGPSVLMGYRNEQSVSALTYDGRLHLTHSSAAPIKSLLKNAVALLLHGRPKTA